MNKAKSYRCRQTGNVLYAADIPDRWKVTRYLPPKVKQAGKMVQPKIQFIFPPASEEDYSQYLFDLADIDPIQPRTIPEHDKFSQRAELGEPVKIAGEYAENWLIREKHPTTEGLKDALIQKINLMALKKRNKGIVYEGIKLDTDPHGLVMLDTAKKAGQPITDFVNGSETHKVSQDKIDLMFIAVSIHIQNIFTEEANLITAVKKSTDPITVDLSTIE